MTAGPTTALVALMLGGALVGAGVSRRLRLPGIVGWILAGLALKWALAGLAGAGLGVARDLASAEPEALHFLKRLALVAVMLAIGMAFELHHLRRLGRAVLWVGLAQAAGAAALTFLACLTVGHLAGIERPVLMASLFGTIAIAISPAATLLTLRQYGAKGHVTDQILTITGLTAVVAVMLFDLSLLLFVEVGWVQPPGGAAGIHLAALKLISATAGSVLTGVAAGLVLTLLHARSGPAQTTVSLLAVVLAILALAEPLNLDYLLVSLLAGVTFINLAPDPDRLESRLSVVGGPLFALLFVITGYRMNFEAFASPATVALVAAYVAARAVGKIAAVRFATGRIRAAGEAEGRTALGMLCHGDLAIALVAALEGLFADGAQPGWVDRLSAVVFGAVAIFELTGPLLLKRTVVLAGEVKAFRLYHFPAPVTGAWSQVREGAASLLRRLGVVSLPQIQDGPLRARHVMHANVKLLPAGAGLDEVLHFIERSRLDHFPVVSAQGKFVGTISLADVRDIIYEPDMQNLVAAQDLLEDDLVTASPDDTLEELFDEFRRHKARDLVVLNASGEVLGIVEQRDVLRAMHVEQTRRKADENE